MARRDEGPTTKLCTPFARTPRLAARALVLLLALTATACSSKISANGGAPGTGGGADGGSGFDAPFFEVGAAPSDADLEVGAPAAGETCAEEVHSATRIPIDLMLLVDASDSMSADAVGGGSKYQQVKQALLNFVADPDSAGLGLGLQFFPLPGVGSSCRSDLDCGYVTSPTTPACQPVSVCKASVVGGAGMLCDGAGMLCPTGDTCVPLGRCTQSLDDCTDFGQPCPGGVAGDTCMALDKICNVTDIETCSDATAYQQPTVPVRDLPAPATHLITRGFALHGPSGNTPLGPASEGTLAYFRQRLAQSGRKGALVLATDGLPSPGCTRNTQDEVANLLAAAHTGTPAIDTYVIGVYAGNEPMSQAALAQLATSGGTGKPFIIDPTQNIAQTFAQTLDQIRGQALSCEFTIPPPKMGTLDFGKVNLHFKNAAGESDIPYTATAARCDPTKGGWYYDVDPATGGQPTRIIACDATCQSFKSDPKASVDLRFGCKTRVID